MNKKKAIKVLGASAIAASAFVATSPSGADAASAKDVQSLVKAAKDAGTVLKWAISTEGSADGTTRPWAQYNAAKAARDKAVAAINTLPAAQKAGYLADIEQNVNLHINRTMSYIDAITAGEKINVKKAALEAQIAKNLIDDNTEAAYHALSTEIRKQAILLDRVYGQTTRDEIRANYKKAAETVRDSVKYEVSAKIELDLAKKAIAANDTEAAEKHLTEATKYMKDVKNEAMKSTLVKAMDEVEAQLTPVVKSVSAINLKQIEVKFNTTLDKETAEDISNYTVATNSAFSTNLVASNWTAKLQSDNKTVVLTNSGANASLASETVFFIKTDDIYSTNKSEVATEAKTFQTGKLTADVTAPQVTGTKVVGSNLEVQVSEPLTAAPTVVRVNGVNVNATLKSGDNTVVLVPLAGLASDVAHSLYINGAKDAASNEFVSYTGSFTVSSDKQKPSVKEIKQISDTTFAVYFSEDLGSNSFTSGDVTSIDANGTVSTPAVGTVLTDSKGEKYYPVTLPAYASGSDSQTLTLTIAKSVVNDASGNENELFTGSYTFSKDKTAPVLTKNELVKNASGLATGVKLVFSEAVTADTAKIRILKDNVELIDTTTYSVTGTGKEVVLDFGAGATLPTGKYTIQFNEGSIKDVSPAINKNAAFTVNVEVGGPAANVPTVDVANSENLSDDAANVIKVKYNQKVDVASATNLSNYLLDGVALDSTKANAAYITYDADNNPIVTIELKDGWNNFGNVSDTTKNAILTVKDVKDTNGAVISNTNVGVRLHDNKAAILTSAVKTGNSIVLTFDEALKTLATSGTDYTNDLIVKDSAGNALTPASVVLVSGNNKQVQLNFTSIAAGEISVETQATATLDLTDLNGLKVKSGVKVTAN